MEKLEIVFKFIQNLFWILLVDGVMAILAGVLIVIYPDLLGILVGSALILMGLAALVFAFKVRKFAKFQIKI